MKTMINIRRIAVGLALLAGASACSLFQDQAPEFLSFRLEGSPGEQVLAIYSTAFVAGVNEIGVTEVRIFSSDSVLATLPIDTTFNIAANQQFFVQIEPVDTVDVGARIEIDGRSVVDNDGLIFPQSPWRFVYQFNQLLTELVEVIL